MKRLITLLAVCSCLAIVPLKMMAGENPKTLEIGAAAPDFKLPGVDGKEYTLASFSKAKVLVIVFTCNHCPTAQAYEERIKQLVKDYSSKGVQVVAIMPNSADGLELSEMGYTELGDSYEDMKLRAKDKQYNFPYLYDGKTEETSVKYGPAATPHVFIFDKERKLRYQGRIDDTEKPTKTPNKFDTRNAIEELLQGKEVTVKTTKVFGCSTKWKAKEDMVKKSDEDWSKQAVSVEDIDDSGLADLMKNNTGKLLLINVWATWCGPCVTEFPELVKINRMYVARDFQFITISADTASQKDKVLAFLKDKHAANKNYLYTGNSNQQLFKAIDPKWLGTLPYTILVEPGGKIVYAKQNLIDPLTLKKNIVDNKLIGRVY